nr:hypothetical protein Iba_chr11cCG7700 [Ipomoea batatas]
MPLITDLPCSVDSVGTCHRGTNILKTKNYRHIHYPLISFTTIGGGVRKLVNNSHLEYELWFEELSWTSGLLLPLSDEDLPQEGLRPQNRQAIFFVIMPSVDSFCSMIMPFRLGNPWTIVAQDNALGLMYGLCLLYEEVLEIFQLDDPAAQRHLSASSGTGAFIPGNSTLIFLGGGSGSLFSRISPSSVSSSISSSANIVIPEGISSLSGSKKYQGITN